MLLANSQLEGKAVAVFEQLLRCATVTICVRYNKVDVG
jgi:hypothetical protein